MRCYIRLDILLSPWSCLYPTCQSVFFISVSYLSSWQPISYEVEKVANQWDYAPSCMQLCDWVRPFVHLEVDFSAQFCALQHPHRVHYCPCSGRFTWLSFLDASCVSCSLLSDVSFASCVSCSLLSDVSFACYSTHCCWISILHSAHFLEFQICSLLSFAFLLLLPLLIATCAFRLLLLLL